MQPQQSAPQYGGTYPEQGVSPQAYQDQQGRALIKLDNNTYVYKDDYENGYRGERSQSQGQNGSQATPQSAHQPALVDFMGADGKRYSANEITDMSQAKDNSWYYIQNNGKDYIFYHKKDNGKDKYYYGNQYKVENGSMTGGSFYESPSAFIQGLALGEQRQEEKPNGIRPSSGDSSSCEIGFSGAINDKFVEGLAKNSSEVAERLIERDILGDYKDKKDCVTDSKVEEIRKWASIMNPSLKSKDKFKDSAYSYGLKFFVENFKVDEKDNRAVSPEDFKKILNPDKEFTYESYLEKVEARKKAKADLLKGEKSFAEFEEKYKKTPEEVKKIETEIEKAKNEQTSASTALEDAEKKLAGELSVQRKKKLTEYVESTLLPTADSRARENIISLFNETYEEDTQLIKGLKAAVEKSKDLLVKKNEAIENKRTALDKLSRERETGLNTRTAELEAMRKSHEKIESEPERIVAGIYKSGEERLEAQRKISSIVNEIEAFFNDEPYDFSDFLRKKEDLMAYIQPELGLDEIKRAFVRGIRKKQSEAELEILENDPSDPRNETGELYVCKDQEGSIEGQTEQGNVTLSDDKKAYEFENVSRGTKVKIGEDGKVYAKTANSESSSIPAIGTTIVTPSGKKFELKSEGEEVKIYEDGKEVEKLPIVPGSKIYIDEKAWKENSLLGSKNLVGNGKIRALTDKEMIDQLNKPSMENFKPVDGYNYLGGGQVTAEAPKDGKGSTAVIKNVTLPKVWEQDENQKYDLRVHDFGPEVAVFARKSGEKNAKWMRMDRFPGQDGKLAREGVILMHHPEQEKTGQVYAFKGGFKYLLTRSDLDCISKGTCSWNDLENKKVIGSDVLDFSLSTSDKKDQNIEFALPNNDRLQNGLLKGAKVQSPSSSAKPETAPQKIENKEDKAKLDLKQESANMPSFNATNSNEPVERPATTVDQAATTKLPQLKFVIYSGAECGPCAESHQEIQQILDASGLNGKVDIEVKMTDYEIFKSAFQPSAVAKSDTEKRIVKIWKGNLIKNAKISNLHVDDSTFTYLDITGKHESADVPKLQVFDSNNKEIGFYSKNEKAQMIVDLNKRFFDGQPIIKVK